jgi:hypothetical protein
MSTIELISSEIIRIGVCRGFVVVPEFSVTQNERGNRKKIDLVWLKARHDKKLIGSLRDWQISAAFEIEGFNVPRRRIESHAAQFHELQKTNGKNFPCYTVLYSMARHRRNPDWGSQHPESCITRRRHAASSVSDSMIVLDGREMSWLSKIEMD